ncbi:MAG: choice-of-anchor tandem repeat GloVer-containing protein [Verrucomicrobiia bacterium]
MKMTGEDVGRRAEALFVACAMACLASQARAQDLTGSTNLPTQSSALGQANWNRLSLQGVNLESTNAISRSSSLNVLHTTAATMLSPMASWQSLTNPPPADLIVWWVFDEGSGTTVNDASGNGNSGSLIGDPLPNWANGVTSGALIFDGYQNYVQSDQSFTQTLSGFTVEAWVAVDSTAGENPAVISTRGDDIGSDALADILIYTNSYYNGNSTGLNLPWGDVLLGSLGLVDGRWHHVAGTWDGTNSSLYVDGQLIGTKADRHDPVTWTTPLRLAYRYTNGGCMVGGAIGDLRIYRRALSSNEVAAAYNNDSIGDDIPDWWRMKYFGSGTTTDSVSCASCDPNGDGVTNLEEYQNGTNPLLPPGLSVPSDLIVWWRFDEGTGAFVGDVSGNGHSGLLLGDSPPVWTNGVTSGALNFDGDQNYVQSQLPFLQTMSGYSVEAWFAADFATGENPAILSTRGDDIGFSALADILVYTNSPYNGNSIGLDMQWGDLLLAPMGLFDGNWHHVAGVWDGTNSILYVDGQLVAIQSEAYDPFSWTTPLRLAFRNTNGGCNYGGNIGEVRIHNRALSSDEVAASYNTDTIGDGIPNWWRMKYFGSGTTTNNYSCAACDPTGDGFTNLQKFQYGMNPLVSYAVTVPAQVNSHSTGNPASITELGDGASYTWSIDNGTITDGQGTPAVTWTAGETGTTTLNVSMQVSGLGSLSASGFSLDTPCSLSAIILTPPEVRFGTTNTASVPNPLTTVGVYTNGFIEGITQGSDGNFYGMSSDAADNRVFQITPQGAFTTWTRFYDSGPSTSNGYGAAWSLFYGGGTTNGVSGWPPVKGSGSDPSLYGVNPEGGLGTNLTACLGDSNATGYGTVYKLTPHGTGTTVTILHTFTGGNQDGAYPLGGLVQGTGSDSSNFYGVTEYGGSNICTLAPGACCILGYGTIFKVSTNGAYTLLHKFNGGTDGAYPNELFMGSDGFLYGSNTYGGTNSSGEAIQNMDGPGTVFKVCTNGGTFTVLHQFTPPVQGIQPDAGVTQVGSNVYGTTYYGGTSNAGTVFKVDTNGHNFATLYSFGGESSCPNGALVQGYDGDLYGTTPFGGSWNNGTIFRLSPPGVLTNFTSLYQFTGTGDGNWPNRGGVVPALSLSTFDGYLYGATIGTLFKYIPAAYAWSITNGTIIGPTDSPSTRWTPTVTNGVVTIYLTVTDTTSCVQQVSTTVIAYTGAIAAGGSHSLALRPDGTVWTWGNNQDGELSDGVDYSKEAIRSYPGEVAYPTSCTGQFITNAVAVAAGGDEFIIVADANGTVWADGENEQDEQAGAPGFYYDNVDHYPASPISGPPGFTNVVSVAAGYSHVLALCGNGTVWAWGSDAIVDSRSCETTTIIGQLGDGGLASSNDCCGCTNSPIRSLTPTGTVIVAIAAGQFHSVALDVNSNVWTWGYGLDGELGNGGNTNVFTPAMLTGISNVIAIAAGYNHTIALTADQTLWTWGTNNFGQLGNGTYTSTNTPAPVFSNVVAIAAGYQYTLAVTNGQLYAWGYNYSGQLGTNASAVGHTNLPMLVAGISNVVLVSASLGDGDGVVHSLAMTVDGGTNHCWGWGGNNYGEVGNGVSGYYGGISFSTTNQYTPAQVQFCTRCQRCVQLGTSGILTAQCNGTLYLYFNGEIGSGSYSGMYTAIVSGVTHPVPATSVQFLEHGGPGNGVSFGTVTNGQICTYSASGWCTNAQSLAADPNGNGTNGTPLGCSLAYLDITNAVCPMWPCFSLVGKIQ